MIKLIIWFRPYSKYFLAGWVFFILVFSSIPSLPTLKIHTSKSEIRLDYIIHLFEYGILASLAFLTWSGTAFNPGLKRYVWITAAVVLFAIADEYHQKFIPGRAFNLNDIYSNVAGILLSLVLCMVIFRKVAERLK